MDKWLQCRDLKAVVALKPLLEVSSFCDVVRGDVQRASFSSYSVCWGMGRCSHSDSGVSLIRTHPGSRMSRGQAGAVLVIRGSHTSRWPTLFDCPRCQLYPSWGTGRRVGQTQHCSDHPSQPSLAASLTFNYSGTQTPLHRVMWAPWFSGPPQVALAWHVLLSLSHANIETSCVGWVGEEFSEGKYNTLPVKVVFGAGWWWGSVWEAPAVRDMSHSPGINEGWVDIAGPWNYRSPSTRLQIIEADYTGWLFSVNFCSSWDAVWVQIVQITNDDYRFHIANAIYLFYL